jgi:hypothetical protein
MVDGEFRFVSSDKFAGVLLFIANGLRSRPSRRGDAPSDQLPKPRLALAGLSNSQGPRRNRFRSIANNRRSKHIPARAPPSEFQCEPLAEALLRLPRELARLLSLPGWSWLSSPPSVLPRSRPGLTAPTSIDKHFSSSYTSHYRFVLCQTGGLSKIKACACGRWRKTNFDSMICDALRGRDTDRQFGRHHIARA